MSVTVIFAILPLIVVGAALWLVPSLSRRDQFFGVTVPPAFRRTRMARKILWCYRWWVTAQCALAWGALTFGLPAGTATADAVGPGGGVWAWLPFVWPLVGTLPALLGARNAIRPYAATPVPVGRVRVASLRQRPDALPGGVAAWSGPPVLLLLAAAFVAFHWSAIPVRFAVHWGIDGQPNGWANRSLRACSKPSRSVSASTSRCCSRCGRWDARRADRPRCACTPDGCCWRGRT